MSSFYGNIKFNNQTPLIFDKIYTSRYQMELQGPSDGIFNGRYVLVHYGDVRFTPYHKVAPMNEETFNSLVASGTVFYTVQIENGEKKFIECSDYHSGYDYFILTEYSLDEDSEFAKNKADDENEYRHDYHNTVWQKIWTSTQEDPEVTEKYIMVSHLNAETPKVTMVVDAPSDKIEHDLTNQVFYKVPTDLEFFNVAGAVSEADYNTAKSNKVKNIFIRSAEPDEEGQYSYIPAVSDIDYENEIIRDYDATQLPAWNLHTEYYRLNFNTNSYELFPGSKPYVDGMVSESKYIDLTVNQEIPLFIADGEGYIPATGYNELTHYFFMRYRETDGRPHFDPIMSTDLDYRFHMPRNWKFDKAAILDYNEAGFNPEKASDTNAEELKVLLEEKSSGDLYPVHRPEEPAAAKYEWNKDTEQLEIVKTEQPDTKQFSFDMRMIGDMISQMWDTVYPKIHPEDKDSDRNTFIGNDRDPENPYDYPPTLAEAVRKLYYFLGIKDDNVFENGPWIDPITLEKVYTIFGIMNGGKDLLGDPTDRFDINKFVPITGNSYYPTWNPETNEYEGGGYNKYNDKPNGRYLLESEYDELHNGGAGPLFVLNGENQYDQATEYNPDTQYYRNMNSLFALLRAWQDGRTDTQGDWTFEKEDDFINNEPTSPRYIRNKPMVLTVIDNIDNDELHQSINWFWANYAT